jgi:hypothetical protein
MRREIARRLAQQSAVGRQRRGDGVSVGAAEAAPTVTR